MGLAKTFLAIGIAIIFVVFVAYGVFVIYEPPSRGYTTDPCYEQFSCNKLFDDCRPIIEEGEAPPVPRSKTDYSECSRKVQESLEYQDCMESQDQCRENWKMNSERFKHSKISFYILFIIAIAAITTGIMLKQYEGIGSGLLFGGILTFLWSLIYTSEYWITWHKYVKLACLGAVLVLLIWLGYKKIESHVKPGRKRK